MEEEFLKLLYDYSSMRRLTDAEYIDKLIEIVVNNKKMSDFVTSVRYEDNPIKEGEKYLQVALYNVVNKYITINVPGITETVSMHVKNNIDKFLEFEQLFYCNYLISSVVLHELEHAYQNKKYNSNLTDIETNLARMGFRVNYLLSDPDKTFDELEQQGYTIPEIYDMFADRRNAYIDNYKYNPLERLAKINSYNFITSSLAQINKKTPNIYNLGYSNYLESLVQGYEYNQDGILVPPTKAYIDGMGYKQDWKNFSFYDEDINVMRDKLFNEHSLIERMSYGLTTTKEEYEQVNKVLVKNKF